MSRVSLIVSLIEIFSEFEIEYSFFEYHTVTEYYAMPPQYYGHDYTPCMIEGDDALWCATYSIIKPNRSNPVWNLIEKYSNDTKRQFRHDLLQRGVCINWCLNKLKHLDNETLASLYVEPFDFGDQVS